MKLSQKEIDLIKAIALTYAKGEVEDSECTNSTYSGYGRMRAEERVDELIKEYQDDE